MWRGMVSAAIWPSTWCWGSPPWWEERFTGLPWNRRSPPRRSTASASSTISPTPTARSRAIEQLKVGRSPWTAADAPSACWQAGQGAGESAPHMDPPDAGYLSQVDSQLPPYGCTNPLAPRPSPPESTLYLMSTKRRTFLQQVALASAATQAEASAQTPAPTPPAPPAAPDIPYPRVFTARHLTAIAFPLRGVAARAISLGGRGQLRGWGIFNRADKGNAPQS